MEAIEREILDKTQYGLKIYAHVLSFYYPDQTVLSISGRHCLPTKNPFRHNLNSLNIVQNGYTFEHSDSEDTSFTGNAFDFAALHYKVKGELLYHKIKHELGIRTKDTQITNEPKTVIVEQSKPKIHIPTFSFFKRPVKNIIPYKDVSLVQVYEYIKSEYASKQTFTLRTHQEKKEIREYKKFNFDYVTFSGVFSQRFDNHLLKHSGLICVDFDHLTEKDILKEKLLLDEYFETEMLFTSPYGDGLKWVIGIDITSYTHLEYFLGIESYIKKVYGYKIDTACKDLSRACFLPHDPTVFINSKYLQQ